MTYSLLSSLFFLATVTIYSQVRDQTEGAVDRALTCLSAGAAGAIIATFIASAVSSFLGN